MRRFFSFLAPFSSLIFLFFITCLILGGDFFFGEGTFFFVDGVNVPSRGALNFFDNSLFWQGLNFFYGLFGYVAGSKIYLFGIVFFAGLLGKVLGGLFARIWNFSYGKIQLIEILGIMFLLFNPVFYERTITQPGIMLGIVFFGYGVYFSLKKILFQEGSHHLAWSGVFFGLSLNVMSHSIFFIACFGLLYAVFFLRTKNEFLWGFAGVFITFLLNVNWIWGNFFLEHGTVLSTLTLINQQNIDNFTTHGIPPFSPMVTTLFLYGFWGEKWGHFILPHVTNPHWHIAGIMVLGIILLGIYRLWELPTTRRLCIFLMTLGGIAFALSLGIVAPWGEISQFLYDHLPLYEGLREPHKWVGVLLISYSVFFLAGVIAFMKWIGSATPSFFHYGLAVCLFLLLNAWSPNILFGFHHQLFLSDYPRDYAVWYDTAIKEPDQDHTYLVFPWHSYIACDWTQGKVFSNVMGQYWKPLDVITSDNIEVGTLYTNSQNPRSRDIETFLRTKDFRLLKKWDITDLVFLDKCADFKTYETLLNDSLKAGKIAESYSGTSLKVYKIR